MTTGEGGMICTDDTDLCEILRMLRSHGMVRESTSAALREGYRRNHPDLEPDFIFAYPAYNVRSTELAAVLGRSQLRRLDANIAIRNRNLAVFLESLDASKYFIDFDTRGCSNYAFTLVLRHADRSLAERVMGLLRSRGVEFRRGLSGGGNQLRQPYLEEYRRRIDLADFPNVEHVHFHGFYIGNSPSIETESVRELCAALNELASG
jgi:CDP-6-deoxy-D-xylo-4-hexulose-3-dehydrase